jgi:hypothetical protein
VQSNYDDYPEADSVVYVLQCCCAGYCGRSKLSVNVTQER